MVNVKYLFMCLFIVLGIYGLVAEIKIYYYYYLLSQPSTNTKVALLKTILTVVATTLGILPLYTYWIILLGIIAVYTYWPPSP